MLDRKFVLQNIQAVKQNCIDRNIQAPGLDRMVQLEENRRGKLHEVEELNRRANEVSKSIGKAANDEEREARKEEGRQLRAQKDAAQQEHDQLDEEIRQIELTIPNMAHPEAPIGDDDKSNLEVGKGRYEPRVFEFSPLDHVELGTKNDWIDFEGGARTTGSGDSA